VIVADARVLTGVVVIVKLADDAPLPIVTLLGTVAAALLLCNDTTAPPLGAIPFNVTVPVTLFPPAMLCGFRLMAVNEAGFTSSVAVTVPLAVAEIVAELGKETPLEVTLNVAVIAPGRTFTDEGTLATDALLLDRITCMPASGAGPFRVMEATDTVPPMTVVGFRLILCTCGGVTVREAETLAVLEETKMVPSAVVATG